MKNLQVLVYYSFIKGSSVLTDLRQVLVYCLHLTQTIKGHQVNQSPHLTVQVKKMLAKENLHLYHSALKVIILGQEDPLNIYEYPDQRLKILLIHDAELHTKRAVRYSKSRFNKDCIESTWLKALKKKLGEFGFFPSFNLRNRL